jgi:RecA/RadA recombinase
MHSASGKSHFGLQLALTAQLPSCSADPGGAILLTSERKISFTRLEQIAQSRLAEDAPVAVSDTRRFLDNVHTMHVTEVDGLEHALAYMVPNVIESSAAPSAPASTPHSARKSARLPISLIVIDSIGALFRASYDSNQGGLSQRSRMLCVLADRLKYLAYKYNIAVLVVNQVSDVFGTAPLLDGPSQISRPNSPALTSDNGRGITHSGQRPAHHDLQGSIAVLFGANKVASKGSLTWPGLGKRSQRANHAVKNRTTTAARRSGSD